MAGKRMRLSVIILAIGSLLCLVFGYLIYKLWIDRKRKRKIGFDVTQSQNASSRRRRRRRPRSRRRRPGRLRRRRPSRSNRRRRPSSSSRRRRRSRRPTAARRAVSRAPSRSVIHPAVIPPTASPMNATRNRVEQTSEILAIHPSNARHPREGYDSSRRPAPSRMDERKSRCLCLDCCESYSGLLQMAKSVDATKNILPCDENDEANVSRYQYELNYDEEHLFRC